MPSDVMVEALFIVGKNVYAHTVFVILAVFMAYCHGLLPLFTHFNCAFGSTFVHACDIGSEKPK